MVENVEQYFVKNPEAYFYSEQLGADCAKSVHYNRPERFHIAKDERNKPIVPLEKIVEYVNDLLESIGIKKVDYIHAKMKPDEIDYSALKNEYHLEDERDIIWMKFTKSGHLGVVAVSNDVGFDMPTDRSEYDSREKVYNKYRKCYEERWKYTSSGILVHSLNEEWDKSFVLVFPLEKSSKFCRYDRHEIETAVGNYLQKKNVPIIDYYSHNY